MIDATGEFILILIVSGYMATYSGLATETMPSLEACKAAQVQLQVQPRITAICIAKDVKEGGDE